VALCYLHGPVPTATAARSMALVFVAAILSGASPAAAEGDDESERATKGADRQPLPEPVLQETTTDLDGTEPGEVEIEGAVSMLRARRGGAFAWQLGPELEMLATRRLGFKVEPFFERAADAGASAQTRGGARAGLSWKLVQDFEHDFHLQAEAGGSYPADATSVVEPGESALPFTIDLRSGLRRGAWTLRNSLGASAGGGATPSSRLGARASAAILTDFEATGRFGFWGVEVEADGARANPVLVAIDLVPNLEPAGLPFAIGFVLPYSVGTSNTAPSYGFLVRLFIESSREQAYARTGEAR
jgi:hypothetical protein